LTLIHPPLVAFSGPSFSSYSKLVSESVLLLIVTLVAGVVPVGIIVLVGGVKLLPLGLVGD
jgi:hypothetical protein